MNLSISFFIYEYIQYIGLLTIAMSNLEDPGGKPPPFHLRHFSQNSLKRPPDTIGEGSENMSWTSTRLDKFWDVLKWPFLYQTQSLHTNIQTSHKFEVSLVGWVRRKVLFCSRATQTHLASHLRLVLVPVAPWNSQKPPEIAHANLRPVRGQLQTDWRNLLY